MRHFRLQIIALFAVLSILLSGAAAASVRYRCSMSGRLLDACCCAKAGAARATNRPVEVRAPDCCEKVVSAARAGATATFEVDSSLPAAVATAFVFRLDLLPRPSVETHVIWRDRAPPAIGPPLFLKNCSFLS
jgi:hypothetical protein